MQDFSFSTVKTIINELGCCHRQLGTVAKSFVLREKSVVTLTVTAAGSGFSFVWQKSSGAPPVVETLIGKTLKSLPLTNLNPGTDSGTYTCEVRLPGSTAVAGTFDLRVFRLP